MSEYLFGRTGALLDPHLDALASLLDGRTTTSLERTGVTEGWRCLEIGGGGGSVARWLATRVGAAGHVTVTDVDTDRLGHLDGPTTTVLRHDVVHDDLPPAAHDLVHARLVLCHLPQREAVLGRLRETLRPGGWLALEEFDAERFAVLAAPSPADAALLTKSVAALTSLLEKAGTELRWGSRAATALRDAGFRDVEGVQAGETWVGGSPGSRLLRTNLRQVRERALAAKLLTEDELDRFDELVVHPAVELRSFLLCSVRGRR
ncbi:class I SAM-dependent methyltransferase [Umezawaea beigongshangensis]|uniref:class I SAM-dependent methyltransferase n=1 Tax=Umezawaea beigongshangensis TaxID=2780383 RepID=UPI0018F164CA|nr:class I SAM-dependent methyltransferase [Umezawaea beigongshangensis]